MPSSVPAAAAVPTTAQSATRGGRTIRPARGPSKGASSGRPPKRTAGSRGTTEAVAWQAALASEGRRALLAPISPGDTEHPAGPRVGVKPYDPALRRQPFDTVMISAVGVGKRSLRVIKASRPAVADIRQNAIEREDLRTIVAARIGLLRPARRRGRACHGGEEKKRKERAPAHEVFYRGRDEPQMNAPSRSRSGQVDHLSAS
jgi:hypothetical protein